MITKKDFNEVLITTPHCILGKAGITDEFLKHVTTLLKRNKAIKIKALKNIATKANIKDLAKIIAEKTNTHLLDVRGKIIIISKYPLAK
ncbi:MAG: ribosome assembly RNA-binding protein YhbY [Promethearchaeota archaeon]|nr:MAG: ribosome assembly RNA-binding protein YhbY [Candidatus Lokiarchaeota archaeon]